MWEGTGVWGCQYHCVCVCVCVQKKGGDIHFSTAQELCMPPSVCGLLLCICREVNICGSVLIFRRLILMPATH